MGEFASYYVTLGLQPWASPVEVKRAYRALARQWHPDRFPEPSQKAEAEAKLKQINLAYEKLKDFTPPEAPPQPASPQAPSPPTQKSSTQKSPAPKASTQTAPKPASKSASKPQSASTPKPDSPKPAEAPSWPLSHTVIHGGGITALALRAGRGLLISANRSGSLMLWQFIDGQLFNTQILNQTLAHTGQITALALSPDQRHLISSGADGNLKIWRLQSARFWRSAGLRLVRSIEAHRLAINAVAIVGKHLITVGEDGLMQRWRWSSGKLEERLEENPIALRILAVSPDGRWLCRGDANGDLTVLSISRSGSTYHLPASVATAVTFGPTGASIAWGDRLGWVYLATRQGAILHQLPAHADAVINLQFSPCGRWLVSTGCDRAVRIWDPISGQLQASLAQPSPTIWTHPNQQGNTTSLLFTPDSKKLITAGDEPQIQIWQSPL